MKEIRWRWHDDSGHEVGFRAPRTHNELAWALDAYWGLQFPRRAVCPGHTAPFDALAEAYFAETPISVWWASRGLGGKTTLLGGLGLVELLSMLDVTILGGSGEQTARVHAVTRGAWRFSKLVIPCPGCGLYNPVDEDSCLQCGESVKAAEPCSVRPPLHLLDGEPLASVTRTKWGNALVALTASTKSVRGPHPQRLRVDEADEADLEIVDAAMGQTMSSDTGRPTQTVFASTYQYPSGTMTELLNRAKRKGWPVRKWCYKETLLDSDNPGSWLTPENIERKRQDVTGHMWRVEYDLELPEEGGNLFKKVDIDAFFCGTEVEDPLNEDIVLEEVDDEGEYATGADWAKQQDLSVLCTLRIDVVPARVVKWSRYYRQQWPWVIGQFNERVEEYPGPAAHDATGIGDVVEDYLEVKADAVTMVGAKRYKLFIVLEKAVEDRLIGNTRPIASLVDVMRSVKRSDLYGGGHPPDEIVALAMAVKAANVVELRSKRGGRLLRPRSF